MKYVQIIFAGNYEAKYDFKTDLDLKVDDQVVCHTTRGFSVGKVVGFVENSTKATDWVVQKVDVERYHDLLLNEQFKGFSKDLKEMLGL